MDSLLNASALSGFIAGGVTRTLTAPLDVIKIRFQLQLTKDPKYTSMYHALRLTTAEEGIFAFWKGNLTATYLGATYGMVQFATHDLLKTQVLARNGYQSHQKRFVLGRCLWGSLYTYSM